MRVTNLACVVGLSTAALFDANWQFLRGDDEKVNGCDAAAFPQDFGDQFCSNLTSYDHSRQFPFLLPTPELCQQWCCEAGDSCDYWQFCEVGKGLPCETHDTGIPGLGGGGCWLGTDSLSGKDTGRCRNSTDGYVSRGRPAATGVTGRAVRAFAHDDFDDSKWRSVDTPHDWSIEALPPRDEDETAPVLSTRYGDWSFSKGDDPSWSAAAFDDSTWKHVKGGEDWRAHSNYTEVNATGWYRQHLPDVPQLLLDAADKLILDIGIISGADHAYLNGQLIGQTGNWENPDCDAYLAWRQYKPPKGLLKKSGNVLAIRMFSVGGSGNSTMENPRGFPGGLFDDARITIPDQRSGAYDAGASLNGRSLGYTVGGVGWYRKTFELDAAAAAAMAGGGKVGVTFDGVYMHSDTYVNGHYLGHHPYGYTTHSFDLSKFLRPPPAQNVLAVRVANRGLNSRWYTGSGIYRHVHLTVTDAVHFKRWGISVTTPTVTHSAPLTAVIRVASTLVNEGAADAAMNYSVSLVDPDGRLLLPDGLAAGKTVTVKAGAELVVTDDIQLGFGSSSTGGEMPQLWSDKSAKLYTANVRMNRVSSEKKDEEGGQEADAAAAAAAAAVVAADSELVTFGIRSLSYSADKGFLLNGVSTKFYGGCLHHDNGALGAAAFDRAEERRVQLLKAQGYNAIRTSHNPVSPAFLDACDREGILVMDEAFDTWRYGKNPDDYRTDFDAWWRRDLEALVLRDRNHPSVVMWSIGNEIPMRGDAAGDAVCAMLTAYVRQLDDTAASGRAITSAVPAVGDELDPFFAPLDVAGYNYSPQKYEADHKRLPDRIIVGTESFAGMSFDMWDLVWNNSYVLGDFIWTAMDYIGESAIGFATQTDAMDECDANEPFPWHISFCGDVDIIGQQKAQARYRTVLWGQSQLEMAVHKPQGPDPRTHERIGSWGWPEEEQSWTWAGHEGADVQVTVYAKDCCDSVALFFNGSKVSEQPVNYASEYKVTFTQSYQPGVLKAVGMKGGNPAPGATKEFKTAGAVAKLTVEADRASLRADPNDLSFLTVSAFDAAGVPVPFAETEITVSIAHGAAAKIVAVATGNPRDVSDVLAMTKKLWNGKALAIVQPLAAAAPGPVTVKVTAAGVPDVEVVVTTTASGYVSL
jgi:beta-galactosidase